MVSTKLPPVGMEGSFLLFFSSSSSFPSLLLFFLHPLLSLEPELRTVTCTTFSTPKFALILPTGGTTLVPSLFPLLFLPFSLLTPLFSFLCLLWFHCSLPTIPIHQHLPQLPISFWFAFPSSFPFSSLLIFCLRFLAQTAAAFLTSVPFAVAPSSKKISTPPKGFPSSFSLPPTPSLTFSLSLPVKASSTSLFWMDKVTVVLFLMAVMVLI